MSTLNNMIQLKYVIIGDSGVGKSCLTLQFTDKTFDPTHELTIGAEFGFYKTKHNGEDIILQLWDTAGQDSYKHMTKTYYRHCDCAILVFDITNRQSYNNISNWLETLTLYTQNTNEIEKILVGNKCDLNAIRNISFDEANNFARIHNMTYFETSAKTNHNIDRLFLSSVSKIYDRHVNFLNQMFYGQRKKSFNFSSVLSEKNTASNEKKQCC